MKSKKNRQREVYDIDEIKTHIIEHTTSIEPYEFTERNMGIFGVNVNLKRYIQEMCDGLIPVYRRLIVTMYLAKLYNGKFSKSTQIIGECIKKLHPHSGDSVYSAQVDLGQEFRNNIALITSETNYGSAYDPDSYAADRYTNASLSDFTVDCYFSDWALTSLTDADMTVDWISNYDDSCLEPMYLPAKYPLALLNWRKAMGLGRYTSIVGFNLEEAFRLVITLMDDPDAKVVIYPDDPNGCTLINKYDCKNILDDTGVKIRMRGNYNISHYNGRDIIEITSVPYEVKPYMVKEAIQRLAKAGELPEISDIDGCSDNLGATFRISIEVRKGYDPEAIMNKLYKKTQLEQTYVMQYAFVNGVESVDYTLRIYILEWIRYRRNMVRKIYKIRRTKNLKRIHFLEPLIKVLESGKINQFIDIIRETESRKLIKTLMRTFNLTDYQAERISDVKLSALSADKLKDYKSELKKLKSEDIELSRVISSNKEIDKIIKAQLEDGIKKYGKPRKSKVIQLIDSAGSVPNTYHFLVFTRKYLKKLPYDDRGYRIGRLDNGEKVKDVKVLNNRDTVLIFTKDGRCLPILVNDIGNSATNTLGVMYNNIGCKDTGYVASIAVKEDSLYGSTLVSITNTGIITKTKYDELKDKNKSFAFMKVKDCELVDVKTSFNKDDKVLIYTSRGNAVIFELNEFETTAVNTKGINAIKLKEDEKVIGMTIITSKHKHLVVLTDRGYVKKILLNSLPTTKRCGKNIEINSSNGMICDIIPVKDYEDKAFYIYTTAGTVFIDINNIESKTRLAKGVKYFDMKSGDYAFGIE